MKLFYFLLFSFFFSCLFIFTLRGIINERMKGEDVKKNETNFLFILKWSNDNVKDENDMGILLIEWRYWLLIFFSFYKRIWKIEVKFVDSVFPNCLSIVNFVTVIYWFTEIWNFMIYFYALQISLRRNF